MPPREHRPRRQLSHGRDAAQPRGEAPQRRQVVAAALRPLQQPHHRRRRRVAARRDSPQPCHRNRRRVRPAAADQRRHAGPPALALVAEYAPRRDQDKGPAHPPKRPVAHEHPHRGVRRAAALDGDVRCGVVRDAERQPRRQLTDHREPPAVGEDRRRVDLAVDRVPRRPQVDPPRPVEQRPQRRQRVGGRLADARRPEEWGGVPQDARAREQRLLRQRGRGLRRDLADPQRQPHDARPLREPARERRRAAQHRFRRPAELVRQGVQDARAQRGLERLQRPRGESEAG
mmetsp:Transcript_2671/g.8312  ORF Transcript_2671/g.8312 Transcript_2671/m.8312 type:complete len:288 (+) Transcript_2671:354-1217(+)